MKIKRLNNCAVLLIVFNWLIYIWHHCYRQPIIPSSYKHILKIGTFWVCLSKFCCICYCFVWTILDMCVVVVLINLYRNSNDNLFYFIEIFLQRKINIKIMCILFCLLLSQVFTLSENENYILFLGLQKYI